MTRPTRELIGSRTEAVLLLGASAQTQLNEYIHAVAPELHFVQAHHVRSTFWLSKTKAAVNQSGSIDYAVIGVTGELLCSGWQLSAALRAGPRCPT